MMSLNITPESIRERIGKQVAVSARIDSGVMFRDITVSYTHLDVYKRQDLGYLMPKY